MSSQAEIMTTGALTSVAPSPSALTLDLLEWVAAHRRCYGEAMEAWRTGCPRFPIWEDALDDGLIRIAHTRGVPLDQTSVSLTALGREILATHRR
jgi:hypothetical protein